MIQIKKTLLTLVALLAVTTQAWAEEEVLLTTITATGASTYSETVAGVVTLSFSNIRYVAPYGWLKLDIDCTATVTVEPTAAYNVTRCVFYQTNNGCLADDLSPFILTRYGYPEGSGTYVDTANGRVSADDYGLNMDGVTSIEVYGTPAGTPVPLTWDATAKTATLTNGMPAGNVTVSVDYYPQATMTSDAVTAVTGAAAATDAELVTVDQTKLTGGTTLMFCVTETDAAPAYTAEGWTTDVPNAKDYSGDAEKDYYVWYYLKGADGDTDDATFSDGDMNTTGLKVTLAPEPTYNVEFAEGTNDDNKWTADPATGVKKGQTVTVTYTGERKVIGVKAEKKAAAPAEKIIKIDGQDYTVLNGETWSQFITRNQLSSWSITQCTLSTWCVCIENPYSDLYVSSDGTNWTQLVFSPQDAPIDTDKQYKWVKVDQ